jgi:hypothetical protein
VHVGDYPPSFVAEYQHNDEGHFTAGRARIMANYRSLENTYTCERSNNRLYNLDCPLVSLHATSTP